MSSFRASAHAVLATSGGLVTVFVTSALAPLLQRDLGLTAARLGVAVAVFFAFSSIAAPLCGHLVDRMGSVRAMRAALVLAALCLMWIGLAVRGWIGLVAVLGCAGVANGAIQPAANRYLGRLVPPRRQGTAFGIKQSAIPAAMLIGGLSLPVATRVTGWEAVYVTASAAVLAIAVVVRVPSAVPSAPAAVTPDRQPRGAGPPFQLPLVVLAVGWGLASAGSNALGAFFVLAAVGEGHSPLTAGLLAMTGSLASMGVRVVAGVLADRRSGSGLVTVAAMSAAGALGMVLLATGLPWTFGAAVVLGYGLGSGWGGLFSYAIVSTHPSRPGRATGTTQAGASAGSCLGPLGFGLLATTAGYSAAWLAAGGALLVAVGTVLAGRHMLGATS
ncbi:MFS transporter [Halosaccharopolyspora lacisalsi]|nr:MFS transporter [Halosaccharopolyspora lacisalsi]